MTFKTEKMCFDFDFAILFSPIEMSDPKYRFSYYCTVSATFVAISADLLKVIIIISKTHLTILEPGIYSYYFSWPGTHNS